MNEAKEKDNASYLAYDDGATRTQFRKMGEDVSDVIRRPSDIEKRLGSDIANRIPKLLTLLTKLRDELGEGYRKDRKAFALELNEYYRQMIDICRPLDSADVVSALINELSEDDRYLRRTDPTHMSGVDYDIGVPLLTRIFFVLHIEKIANKDGNDDVLNDRILEGLTNVILYDDLRHMGRSKASDTEYPFLSFRQHLRRTENELLGGQYIDNNPSDDYSAKESVELSDIYRIINRSGITQKEREYLSLYTSHGLKYSEMARMYDVSRQSVHASVTRAFDKILKELRRSDIGNLEDYYGE